MTPPTSTHASRRRGRPYRPPRPAACISSCCPSPEGRWPSQNPVCALLRPTWPPSSRSNPSEEGSSTAPVTASVGTCASTGRPMLAFHIDAAASTSARSERTGASDSGGLDLRAEHVRLCSQPRAVTRSGWAHDLPRQCVLRFEDTGRFTALPQHEEGAGRVELDVLRRDLRPRSCPAGLGLGGAPAMAPHADSGKRCSTMKLTSAPPSINGRWSTDGITIGSSRADTTVGCCSLARHRAQAATTSCLCRLA